MLKLCIRFYTYDLISYFILVQILFIYKKIII